VLFVALGTALLALLIILVNGKAGYELYLSGYALLYGLAPSVAVLTIITLYRLAVRQPVWAFLKVELLLALLTLLTIAFPFILVRLKVLSLF
jgi:hypothetical protein